MQIIPAIDLYQRQCVRLDQGEFDRLTEYGADPLAHAKNYVEQGASQLHIVDLNGAETGKAEQQDIALAIKQALSLQIQTGGGFRQVDTIESVLATAIDRVVLGSLALRETQLVNDIINRYGVDRFVLAFDINLNDKQPLVAIKGWREKTSISLWDVLQHYQSFTGLRILCTDISRDGMLSSPNFELYHQCLQKFPDFHWQASGGVSQLSDLSRLKELGVHSVIVGKALYENRFTLVEALQTC